MYECIMYIDHIWYKYYSTDALLELSEETSSHCEQEYGFIQYENLHLYYSFEQRMNLQRLATGYKLVGNNGWSTDCY